MINLSAKKIKNLYLGTVKLKKAFLGEKKVYPNSSLSLSATSHTFAAAGESLQLTIFVEEEQSWNISVPSPWRVNATSGKGNATLTITIDNNKTTSSRSNVLTVTSEDLSATCALNQEAGKKVYNDASVIFTVTADVTEVPGINGTVIGISGSNPASFEYQWNGVGTVYHENLQNPQYTWSLSDTAVGVLLPPTGPNTTLTMSMNASASSRSFTVTATLNGRSNSSQEITQQGYQGSATFTAEAGSEGNILLKSMSSEKIFHTVSPRSSVTIGANFAYRAVAAPSSGKVVGYWYNKQFYLDDGGRGSYLTTNNEWRFKVNIGQTESAGFKYGMPVSSLSPSPSTIVFAASDGVDSTKPFSLITGDTAYVYVEYPSNYCNIRCGGLSGEVSIMITGPSTSFVVGRLRTGTWHQEIGLYAKNQNGEKEKFAIIDVTGK